MARCKTAMFWLLAPDSLVSQLIGLGIVIAVLMLWKVSLRFIDSAS